MIGARRLIAFALVGAAALAVGSCSWSRLYAAPVAAKRAKLDEHRREIARFRQALDGRFAVQGRLDRLVETTLGREIDAVEHRLRTGLSTVVSAAGLSEVTVNNGRPRAEGNPAGRERIASAVRRRLREQVDFHVVRGQVSGYGGLGQVFTALAAVASQPWIHRVEGFSIAPAGREGTSYQVRIDFATLLLADLGATQGEGLPAIAPENPETIGAVQRIVAKNLFVMPVSPEPEPVRVAVKPPANASSPPPPPYGSWRLTGIVGGALPEVLMTGPDDRRAALQVGQGVLDAILVGATDDAAMFEIGDSRFSVLLGTTLNDRRRIDD